MEPSFPPAVILPHDAPLPPPWTFPPVEPVQRATELSLTMPLSADMGLVRDIAELADNPGIYAGVFGVGLMAMGLGLAIVGRPPSFSEAGKTFNAAILIGAALTVVSMISPLPIGIAVLISGLLGAVSAAMLFGALLFRGLGLVSEWIARWAAAKPGLHRSNPLLWLYLLLTRPWFRSAALVVGIALIGTGVLYRFAPFLPLGAPMIVASFVPRQVWRRQARAEFRMAKALLDRARPSHPVTP